MPRSSQPGRSVSSRLLDVLFSFEPGATELTLAQLTRRTGLPHATARRLALELTEVGALEQRANGRFVVGLRLWRLGTLAPLTESLRTMAQPFMEDLYSALRQHVQLAVLDGSDAVVIERLSAPRAVGITSQVGGRLPLHCSGVGKVLLRPRQPEAARRDPRRRVAAVHPKHHHRRPAPAPRARGMLAYGRGGRPRGTDCRRGLDRDADHGQQRACSGCAVGRRPQRLRGAPHDPAFRDHQRTRHIEKAGLAPRRTRQGRLIPRAKY